MDDFIFVFYGTGAGRADEYPVSTPQGCIWLPVVQSAIKRPDILGHRIVTVHAAKRSTAILGDKGSGRFNGPFLRRYELQLLVRGQNKCYWLAIGKVYRK